MARVDGLSRILYGSCIPATYSSHFAGSSAMQASKFLCEAMPTHLSTCALERNLRYSHSGVHL